MYKVLDIFSGIGGFSFGLEKSGMKTVAFCEINPFCQKVLSKHWPDVPLFHDITLLGKKDLPQIDVIAGGFPCQDISIAGKKKGINAERSGLWTEFARLINEIRPKYAIIENVANLRSQGLARVLKDLWKIGYNAEWHCIPASAVGGLHRRDRIWIIAYPNIFNKERLPFREKEEESPSGERNKDATDSYCKRCNSGQHHRKRGHLQNNANREYSQIQQKRDIGESGACKVCQILPDTDQQGLQGCGRLEEISPICTQTQISTYYRLRGVKQWQEEPLDVPRLKNDRLNPDWVEWLMGYPIGWTEGGSFRERIMALGNSVVPLIPEFLGMAIDAKEICTKRESMLLRKEKIQKGVK